MNHLYILRALIIHLKCNVNIVNRYILYSFHIYLVVCPQFKECYYLFILHPSLFSLYSNTIIVRLGNPVQRVHCQGHHGINYEVVWKDANGI